MCLSYTVLQSEEQGMVSWRHVFGSAVVSTEDIGYMTPQNDCSIRVVHCM